MPESNRRQAMVPSGARVIGNSRGSAPGLWLEEGESVILLLPGPPRELKPMFIALVEGPLRARAAGAPLVRRVLKIAGRIESQTDEALQPLYRVWAEATPPITATILAALGQIELHLATRPASTEVALAALDAAIRQVSAVIGEDVFSTDGRSMEAVVGGMLASRGYRIALAESCTGGLLTSRLTDVAGSSRYVDRAVVAYSNKAAPKPVPSRLPAAEAALDQVREFAPDLRQIPAAVVDQGPLRRVPYLSYRAGDVEFNAYGDPDRPACLEIGVYGDPARRPAARDALAGLLSDPDDRNAVKALDPAKDKQTRGGLTFEVTPETAADAYGAWWVSVYDAKALDASRASEADMKAVAVPRPAEEAAGRPGKTIYVKGYRRKDGTYVPGYTKTAK